MNELKCKECGAILVQGVTECASCGCPVETGKNECVTVSNKHKNANAMSILSIFFGVIIVIMGIIVINKDVSMATYSAKQYDADYAAFGGDFYTEIYGASDIIVDELNDINGGVGILTNSMVIIQNGIFYAVGMLMVALGLGIIAISCNYIKRENII